MRKVKANAPSASGCSLQRNKTCKC